MAQRLDDHTGLGIGAHQHCLVGPDASRRAQIAYAACDSGGLEPFVLVRADRRSSTGGSAGTEAATSQHGRRGREDLGRRPEVVQELDRSAAGKVDFEIGEVGGVGAVPSVDRLIRVADHTEG